MSITSSDIDNQSFSVERKGYNTEEVDLFLERVSKEVDNFNNTIANLEKKGKDESGELFAISKKEKDELLARLADREEEIRRLSHEVETKTADSKTISDALIVAQRSADKIVADANEKADKIIKDANDRSDYIAKDAETQKKKVMDDIEKLQDKHSKYKKEYEEMLSNIIEKMNKNLGDSRKSSGPKTNNAGATGSFKKASHVHSASSAVTAANKPIQGTGAFSKPAQQKPAKDFSGYGDAVFGDEKID